MGATNIQTVATQEQLAATFLEKRLEQKHSFAEESAIDSKKREVLETKATCHTAAMPESPVTLKRTELATPAELEPLYNDRAKAEKRKEPTPACQACMIL